MDSEVTSVWLTGFAFQPVCQISEDVRKDHVMSWTGTGHCEHLVPIEFMFPDRFAFELEVLPNGYLLLIIDDDGIANFHEGS